MPRRLSQKDQDFAIERLLANRGDVSLTAKELGISRPTLYRLRKLRMDSQFSLSSNGSQPASTPINSNSLLLHTEGLPSDDLQALLDLEAEMVRAAKYIAVNIIAAVEAAPLGQRVTALAQLIDRISKLAAQLSAAQDEEILIYEGENDYEDEDAAEKTSPETSGDFEE